VDVTEPKEHSLELRKIIPETPVHRPFT